MGRKQAGRGSALHLPHIGSAAAMVCVQSSPGGLHPPWNWSWSTLRLITFLGLQLSLPKSAQLIPPGADSRWLPLVVLTECIVLGRQPYKPVRLPCTDRLRVALHCDFKCRNPRKRPTAHELLGHDFLRPMAPGVPRQLKSSSSLADPPSHAAVPEQQRQQQRCPAALPLLTPAYGQFLGGSRLDRGAPISPITVSHEQAACLSVNG